MCPNGEVIVGPKSAAGAKIRPRPTGSRLATDLMRPWPESTTILPMMTVWYLLLAMQRTTHNERGTTGGSPHPNSHYCRNHRRESGRPRAPAAGQSRGLQGGLGYA